MNTDQLIEQLHNANAQRRQTERTEGTGLKPKPMRHLWPIAIPAAALLALLLWPRGTDAIPNASNLGIYCNSQCNPDEVMALIDDNINHIKKIRTP